MTDAAFDRLAALVQAKGECDDAQALAELREAIAALAAARDAAKAANEAKTRYLASVAHEIRSPLNAIYGYGQLLERNNGRDAVRAARVIRRSSEHLSHLVEGLLDMAQVESGALRLSRDTIRLRAFLEQLVDMLQLQAQARDLALVLDCPPGLPEFVHADQKRLRQVLLNLLSNAIKFTDRGQVTLKVHYRNQLASFAVIDTGIGIAPEDAARIFEPFERVGAAAEGRPGIGLGLAITQALVRIMGGDIGLASTPGGGSCFTVRLMLSQPLTPPVEDTAPAAVTGYAGRTRRVLLVDDDAAHRALVTGLLEPLGFAVSTAEEGGAALALAASEQPDLVLCDVALPGMSGWDVAASLRRRHGPGLRIVMLSGEDARGGADVADAAWLSKPFDFRELIGIIGDQLELHWHHAPNPAALPVSIMPAHLASVTRANFVNIEKLVKTGQIRAIEAEIEAIAANGPEASQIAERLRVLLDSFDLTALSRFARAAQSDERCSDDA